jgi:hypothetical protein
MVATQPMQDDGGKFDYDIFLSFTGADRRWADWIAAELAAAEHPAGHPFRVLYQGKDFVPGTNWVQLLHDGIQRSERTLAVLSPDYLERSPFGTAEWQTVWPTDPNGLLRRLVPVRVSSCQPTGLLISIVYIDLVDIDEASCSARLRDGLFAAITGAYPPPAGPPSFPR